MAQIGALGWSPEAADTLLESAAALRHAMEVTARVLAAHAHESPVRIAVQGSRANYLCGRLRVAG